MSKDNFIRKLEKVIKPIYIIGLFILVLLIGFCREAKADVSIEVGAGFLSGQHSEGISLILTEHFDNKYSVAIGYISEQWVEPRTEPRTFVREQVFIQGYRNVNIGKGFSLAVGIGYFNGTNRVIGSRYQFTLRAQYAFAQHWSVNVQHNSNAGSQRPNMGQDQITVGYRF